MVELAWGLFVTNRATPSNVYYCNRIQNKRCLDQVLCWKHRPPSPSSDFPHLVRLGSLIATSSNLPSPGIHVSRSVQTPLLSTPFPSSLHIPPILQYLPSISYEVPPSSLPAGKPPCRPPAWGGRWSSRLGCWTSSPTHRWEVPQTAKMTGQQRTRPTRKAIHVVIELFQLEIYSISKTNLFLRTERKYFLPPPEI